LRRALDEELSAARPKALGETAARLSARYRSNAAGRPFSFVQSDEDALAYAAYRLPATYAGVAAALAAVQRISPGLLPSSVLDIGAGPGTAAWAAVETFPSLEIVSLVEPDLRMAALGKRLAQFGPPPLRVARWEQSNIEELPTSPTADLVIAAYVLGEIDESRRTEVLQKLISLAGHVLVLVEPGTPFGYSVILSARALLLGAGRSVVAPCPHDDACPMAGSDWCHFSVRLPRSRIHRQLKAGSLSYEDEKFSYVAAEPEPPRRGHSRIVRHPTTRTAMIRLELCAPQGLRTEVVTKRDKAAFRDARDVRWGDEWPVIDFSKPRVDES
jgi:ribosomal protein RSM22 (predicted rRNA methylase)